MRLVRSLRHPALAVLALAVSASVAFAAVALHDLTGTYESRMLGVRALKGEVKGDSVKFDLQPGGDANIVLSFAGKVVDADHLEGAVDFAGQGGAAFKGTRRKP